MKLTLPCKALFALAAFLLRFGGMAYGQSATGIDGLYYTGANNTGGLALTGNPDPHWTVSYAEIGGTENTTYEGAAYVVSGTVGGWVANTSTAQWITAPTGSSLPGNGTTGANSAYYVYKLAFNISGSGAVGTAVTNQVSITLTIAADDQYSVYVNPVTGTGAAAPPTVNSAGTINAGVTAASGSRTSAWTNTTPLALQNYSSGGGANNAKFVIGMNYLYVVVANTNSQTGNNPSTAINPSGLLVYQVGTAMTIDGKPVVPEVGAVLPVVLALGLFVRQRFFRRALALS